MTYDPDRDAKAPLDVNPNVRPYDRKGFSGMGIMLGAFALLALGAIFLFSTRDTNNVASNQMRAPVTHTPPASIQREPTGSGSSPPAPQTPTR